MNQITWEKDQCFSFQVRIMASLGFRSTSDIKPKALQIQIATHEEILGKFKIHLLSF